MKNQQLPASEVKVHFGEVLNRVVYGKQPVIVTKHNKAVAIIVDMKEWQKHSCKKTETPPRKRAKWLIEADRIRENIHVWQKKTKVVDTLDSVKLIRELRDEMSRV